MPAWKGLSFDLARMNPLTNLMEGFGLRSIGRRAATTVAWAVPSSSAPASRALAASADPIPTDAADNRHSPGGCET